MGIDILANGSGEPEQPNKALVHDGRYAPAAHRQSVRRQKQNHRRRSSKLRDGMVAEK
ncbi:MAG: hypothetical protein ABI134_06235 [Byssovorax sp.]